MCTSTWTELTEIRICSSGVAGSQFVTILCFLKCSVLSGSTTSETEMMKEEWGRSAPSCSVMAVVYEESKLR